MLIELAQYCSVASTLLSNTFTSFDIFLLPQTMEKMHKIKKGADTANRVVIDKVARDFITPIDGEDIIKLVNKIDEITGFIKDVILNIYMFNVSKIKQESIEFSQIVVECCNMLNNIMVEFTDLGKSKKIKEYVKDMNNLKNDADRFYTEAMRTLYRESKNPIEILSWSEIYRSFKKCSTACKNVANDVEIIIIKNI